MRRIWRRDLQIRLDEVQREDLQDCCGLNVSRIITLGLTSATHSQHPSRPQIIFRRPFWTPSLIFRGGVLGARI